jgi:uncharacterized protein
VLLASHDADFAPGMAALLDSGRKVGILAFREFISSAYRELEARGLQLYDLESDAKAFNAPLPRVRVIQLSEFDPDDFL